MVTHTKKSLKSNTAAHPTLSSSSLSLRAEGHKGRGDNNTARN